MLSGGGFVFLFCFFGFFFLVVNFCFFLYVVCFWVLFMLFCFVFGVWLWWLVFSSCFTVCVFFCLFCVQFVCVLVCGAWGLVVSFVLFVVLGVVRVVVYSGVVGASEIVSFDVLGCSGLCELRLGVVWGGGWGGVARPNRWPEVKPNITRPIVLLLRRGRVAAAHRRRPARSINHAVHSMTYAMSGWNWP